MSSTFGSSLQILKDNKLYAKLSKSDFWLNQAVLILGHTITLEVVSIDLVKIEAINGKILLVL